MRNNLAKSVGMVVLGLAAATLPAPASAGESSGFWIPFIVAPAASGGESGLLVMPSNEFEAPSAIHWITKSPTVFLAIAYQSTFTNGALTRSIPAVMMYSAIGADGKIHIYGLHLGSTPTVPKPFQISNLSLTPASEQVCSSSQAQTSLHEPTTLFAVVEIAPTGACGISQDTFELVHFTDSTSTTPTSSLLAPSYLYLDPLYVHSELKGLVGLLGDEVVLFKGDSLQSPQPLGPYFDLGLVDSVTVADGTDFGYTALFINPLPIGFGGGGEGSLERVAATDLALTDVGYGFIQDGDATVDKTSLYFIDTSIPRESSTHVNNFYQLALKGDKQQLLWSGPFNPADFFELIASNGSSLFFVRVQLPPSEDPAEATTTFYSIPVGKTSEKATVLGGPYKGIAVTYSNVSNTIPYSPVRAFLDQPLGSSEGASEQLFATLWRQTGAGATAKISYSTVTIPVHGPYNPKPVPNTAFVGDPTLNSTGVVLEVTGITDTDGGWGGGTIRQFEVGSEESTPVKAVGGSAYVIPAGRQYQLVLSGPFDDGLAGGVLCGIACVAGDQIRKGLLIDLKRSVVVPIGYPKSNVSIY